MRSPQQPIGHSESENGPEYRSEQAGELVDPQVGVFGDGIAAAAATGAGPVAGALVVGEVGAQRTALVDLSLVESEREESSSGIALRRRQKRRRCSRRTGRHGTFNSKNNVKAFIFSVAGK